MATAYNPLPVGPPVPKPSATAAVQRITQQTAVDANGVPSHHVMVTYTVGSHGPFTFTIPSAQFSAAAVRTAMDRMASEINLLSNG